MSRILRHCWLLPLGLWVVLLCAARARADEAFAAATKFYQSSQWQPAAAAFDRVVADSRQPAETRQMAQLYAGEALMQLGQFAQAVQRYQQVQKNNLPERLAAQTEFRLGEATWLSGNSEAAARLLQAYVEQYPQGASISFAREYLDQIRSRKSDQQDFEVLEEAVGWERNGRHDAALAAYGELLKQPLSGAVRAETLRRTALLHARLAQSHEAIRLYQTFLAENPASQRTAEVQLAMAKLYDRLDQSAQAADQYRGVVLKFPQSAQAVDAAYWLARQAADKRDETESHHEKAEADQATEYVDWLLARKELSSERPDVWGQTLCLKCQLLAGQDDWQQIDQVVTSVRERLHAGPLEAKLVFWLAEAAFRLRHYDLARTRYAELPPKTIGINEPWVGMVPLRRAQLAARRLEWSTVLKILDQLDSDYPEFELDYEVDYLRGRALAGRGEMTAARRWYGQVLASKAATDSEAAVMAQWMIGETFFHQRDYQRARAAYQCVMEQNKYAEWQSRGALQAGKCWELEDEWDKAASVYTAALDRIAQSDSDQELESRLRWAQRQSTELR